jgi:hypothetical protein
MNEAVWESKWHVAEVLTTRGVHINSCGRGAKGRLFLLPEESLFLVEIGVLLLYPSRECHVPISVEYAYHHIQMTDGFSLEKYQACS